MSIAICFLARTGLVLGTDSRVTTKFRDGVTTEDSYPKLVQFGDLPVALAMVGAGSYGGYDFHSLVAEAHRAWRSRSGPAEVEAVVEAFAERAGEIARASGRTTEMSVWVGGFDPGAAFGQLWSVVLPAGTVERIRAPGQRSIRWNGSADAVNTLWWGANVPQLHQALHDEEVDHGAAHRVVDRVKAACAWGPDRLNWGMPLMSAVDLVRFLLEVQITHERFMPGRGRCGGPTQIVAMNTMGLHWVETPSATFAALHRT